MPQFETAAPFFWSQVFWLIVAFVVLYLLMSKIALPRIAEVLEERQDKIDDDLAKAEKLKNEAEQVLAEYEKAIADARSSAGSRQAGRSFQRRVGWKDLRSRGTYRRGTERSPAEPDRGRDRSHSRRDRSPDRH